MSMRFFLDVIWAMLMKINRNHFSIYRKDIEDIHEKEYMSNMSIEEKVAMISYLRECFYGIEATTGRLQRFFEFVKQK